MYKAMEMHTQKIAGDIRGNDTKAEDGKIQLFKMARRKAKEKRHCGLVYQGCIWYPLHRCGEYKVSFLEGTCTWSCDGLKLQQSLSVV